MPDLRVLAIDLNQWFVAPAVLDRWGNPIERPAHIPLVAEGLPAPRRDGHLGQATSEALDLAERYGSARWLRKVVCGIPTAQFRERLVAMAWRWGIAVAGVPAAYSSVWGKRYWKDQLSTRDHKVCGPSAAAAVLGRRALGHPARRRAQASPGVTTPDQGIEAAGQPAGVENYRLQNADGQQTECQGTFSSDSRTPAAQR